MHKAKYIGVRKRLQGSLALVNIDGSRCTAQFDSFKHKESHGWHKFRTQDFKILWRLSE